jgi:hypothetical protein
MAALQQLLATQQAAAPATPAANQQLPLQVVRGV